MVDIIKRWPFVTWWLVYTLLALLTSLLVLPFYPFDYSGGLGAMLFIIGIIFGFPLMIVDGITEAIGLYFIDYRLLFVVWGLMAFVIDLVWQRFLAWRRAR